MSVAHNHVRLQKTKLCSPGKLLRSFPPLQAKKTVALTVSLVRKIPVDLYEELVHHAE